MQPTVAISVHSVLWWRMEEAKNRKLYTARGMSTVLANVMVFPETKPSTLLCYHGQKADHLNATVNSASNSALSTVVYMFFVLRPSDPHRSVIIVTTALLYITNI